jgi:hypothetical protein
VNVDTAVQEKAVAFPTDARLYHKAGRALVRAAGSAGIRLRQSYVRLGQQALTRQGRYAHARRMKPKSNWVVGIDAVHKNPYDGATLSPALKQVERMTAVRPEEVFVDRGPVRWSGEEQSTAR